MKIFIEYLESLTTVELAKKYELDYFVRVPDMPNAGIIAGKVPIHRITFDPTHLWAENEWTLHAKSNLRKFTCLPSPQIYDEAIDLSHQLKIDKMVIPWDTAFRHEATQDEFEHVVAECIKYADDNQFTQVVFTDEHDLNTRLVKFERCQPLGFSMALLKNCSQDGGVIRYNYASTEGWRFNL